MNEQKLAENGTVLEAAPQIQEKSYFIDLKPIDGMFALLFIALGWIYYFMLSYILNTGIVLFGFAIIYVLLVSTYASVKEHKATKESYFWLIILLALSLSKLLYLNNSFYGVDVLAVHLVAIYWTMSRTGALIEGKVGKWLWLEGVRGIFFHPFKCFFAPFIAIKRCLSRLRKKPDKNNLWLETGIGAVILVPVLLIILPSLFVADQGFALLFQNIFNIKIKANHLVSLICGLICGCYLFSLSFSCAGFNHDNFNNRCKASEKKAMIMPINSIKIIFYTVSAIYLIFVVNAIGTVSKFMAYGLPLEHSYSSYAREGFFEMCWVAAFTLLIIGAAVWTAKESWHSSFHLRLAAVLLSICSLGLISTALTKMSMYIFKHGLTPLRFFTTAFMLFLIIVFVLIIVSTKHKINVPAISTIIFAIFFTGITLINVSGVVSLYNTSRYVSGTLQNETFSGIGLDKTSDEVFSQIALYNRLPQEHHNKKLLAAELYNVHVRLDNSGDIFKITVSDIVAYYSTARFSRLVF